METKTKTKKTQKKTEVASDLATVLKGTTYDVQGKKKGSIDLPETIFGVSWNSALMHQVVTSMLSNARTPVAHAKDRGEVRGGGRKPWQQKGTGRARHGSIRSPIWKGGGVTHGPLKNKNYEKRIPKGMRGKALAMALSKKLKDNEIIFVSGFEMSAPKTATAKNALVSLSKEYGKLTAKKKNAALIVLPEWNSAVVKSFRNIGSVDSAAVKDLNPVSVLKYKYLVIEQPEASIKILEHRVAKNHNGTT